jgi:hypothetical protein
MFTGTFRLVGYRFLAVSLLAVSLLAVSLLAVSRQLDSCDNNRKNGQLIES